MANHSKLKLVPVSEPTLDETAQLMGEYFALLNDGFKAQLYLSDPEKLKPQIKEAQERGLMYFLLTSQDGQTKGVAVVGVREKVNKKKGWIYLLYIKNGTTEQYKEVLQELITFLKNQGATYIGTETAEHTVDSGFVEALKSLEAVATMRRWLI